MNVAIYGKPGCYYCEQAKILCFEKGIPFTYKQVDKDVTREELVDIIGEYKTVPQVFVTVDGLSQHVGGYEQLVEQISLIRSSKQEDTKELLHS